MKISLKFVPVNHIPAFGQTMACTLQAKSHYLNNGAYFTDAYMRHLTSINYIAFLEYNILAKWPTWMY